MINPPMTSPFFSARSNVRHFVGVNSSQRFLKKRYGWDGRPRRLSYSPSFVIRESLHIGKYNDLE
jgi:hypothetical protein